jgi:hypothetical protein
MFAVWDFKASVDHALECCKHTSTDWGGCESNIEHGCFAALSDSGFAHSKSN